MPVAFKRDSDPDAFDPEALRRDRAGSGLTIGLGKTGPRLTLRGEHLTVMVVLFLLVFYLLNVFKALGLESPLKNGGATEASAREHREIIDEMQLSNYILSECLREPGNCPRLVVPKRLNERLHSGGR